MNREGPKRMGWLDRFFKSYYARRPVNATFIGVHDMDSRLPDYSENGAGDTLAEMQDLLVEAAGSDGGGSRNAETPAGTRDVPGEAAGLPGVGSRAAGAAEGDSGERAGDVSRWEALDRRLSEGFLKIQSWEYRSGHFHRGNPSLYTGEAVFGLMSLFLTDFAPFGERLASATARMGAVPALLAQGRENVRRAPSAWTERAIRECTGALAFLTRGTEHLLKGAASDPSVQRGTGGFRSAAGEAARAFEDFRRYLESELRLHPSDHYSCGEEALALYLREGHFLEQGAEEILAYAESELAKAAARVKEHPDFTPDALSGLADLHPPVDRYYATYREMWESVRRRAEDHALLTWPDFPIRYVPRPDWAREASPFLYFLFYRSPAAFNRPPVHDYLVTPIDSSMPPERQDELLRANNDSVIKLNHVVHHGGIGHHVQNWHAFRSPSRVGKMAAVDCASRIAMFCGGTMAEGWACYATDLMAEAGALTPLEAYAEMKGRTRMCARTIVDLRLHLGRMTLEEAADYYQAHAGMGRDAALGEAVKNSMFPGAAVIYLMGTDGIHGLGKEMSARRGPGFALRDFHDEFLSYGSVPVALIGEEMRRTPHHAQ